MFQRKRKGNFTSSDLKLYLKKPKTSLRPKNPTLQNEIRQSSAKLNRVEKKIKMIENMKKGIQDWSDYDIDATDPGYTTDEMKQNAMEKKYKNKRDVHLANLDKMHLKSMEKESSWAKDLTSMLQMPPPKKTEMIKIISKK